MRKTILTTLAFMAVLGGKAQHRADQQKLDNPESFSMIVLGAPQGYMKYDINQPLFELCTAWIADNVDQLNIKSVLCTGDLVEYGILTDVEGSSYKYNIDGSEKSFNSGDTRYIVEKGPAFFALNGSQINKIGNLNLFLC